MYKFIILSVILSCSFADGDVYSACYPYETYCLFSFGPNVIVNTVNQAQKICEDAVKGSWLLEFVNEGVLKNVDEFLSSHSFPEDTKCILNANKVENRWSWITSKSDINDATLKVIKEDGDVIFYHQPVMAGHQLILNNKYAVLCMTGCYSKLETYKNTKLSVGNHDTRATRDQCREICECRNCEIWSWETAYDAQFNGCWYISPIGNGNMSYYSTFTVYKLDKSVKTTDKCIGNIKLPDFPSLTANNFTEKTELPDFPSSTAHNFTEKKQLILVHVIPLSILLAINITAAVIFWRILKKKQRIIQELQGRKGSEQEYEEIDHKFEETASTSIDERYSAPTDGRYDIHLPSPR